MEDSESRTRLKAVLKKRVAANNTNRHISILYQASDGFRMNRDYKTLKGAQKFAHDYVGKTPCDGGHSATSDDGVGRMVFDGCTFRELFPEAGN